MCHFKNIRGGIMAIKTRVKGLHEVWCCGQYLCSTPASTTVYCPKCGRHAFVCGTAEPAEEESKTIKSGQVKK
jgi:hypothetical protein